MATGVLIDCGNGRKIAVDLWKRTSHDALGHFLTHCHADHTEGLSERWAGSRLYCSPLSCAIIKVRAVMRLRQDTVISMNIDPPLAGSLATAGEPLCPAASRGHRYTHTPSQRQGRKC